MAIYDDVLNIIRRGCDGVKCENCNLQSGSNYICADSYRAYRIEEYIKNMPSTSPKLTIDARHKSILKEGLKVKSQQITDQFNKGALSEANYMQAMSTLFKCYKDMAGDGEQ